MLRAKNFDYLAVFILLFFSVLSFLRIDVWQTEFTLWKDSYSKSPFSTKSINNLAHEYLKDGNYEKSKMMFLKSVELNPFYAPSHSNLGTIYLKENKLLLSEKHFKIALKYGPDHSDLHESLGVIYYKKKDFKKALNEFIYIKDDIKYGSQAKKNLLICYNALGYEAGEKGYFVEAIDYFKNALLIDSLHKSSLFGIALSLEENNNKENSLAYWKILLKTSIESNDMDYINDAKKHINKLSLN